MFISPRLHPKLVYGITVADSAQSFLRGQLSFMAETGWDVTLACSPSRGLDLLRAHEGVQVVEIPTRRDISPLADIRSLISWVRLLRRVRPDVISVSMPKAALIGAFAGWLLQVPKRVYVVRGLRLESERGLRRRLLLVMERLTIACSTDVIAVSHSLRDELAALGVTGRKHTRVLGHGSSNGVDALGIQARLDLLDRSIVRRDLGVSDESTFLVAFIGRVRSDKGVPELVEAMSMPPLETAVLATVGESEEPEVTLMLQSLGDRWISLGWCDDVAPVLLGCDALCLPTHREGFPNVVLEAAAARRPVVTTMATGARDSVIDGTTGFLVPVRDPQALAAALGQLSTDPALRLRLGEEACRRVRQDFQPETIWRALDATYRSQHLPEQVEELA